MARSLTPDAQEILEIQLPGNIQSGMNDTYQTIQHPSEGVFRDKGSRFLAFLYPVQNEEDIKIILHKVKKEHFSARHHCYAWRLGQETIRFRAYDDGEPSSTAGKPILGQLASHNLTEVLCVVVRYFGGTLLGVSGLINAYRQAASEAIRNAEIVNRIIETEFRLKCSYQSLNPVMQIIKNENLHPTKTELLEECTLEIPVRKSEFHRIKSLFEKLPGVSLSIP